MGRPDAYISDAYGEASLASNPVPPFYKIASLVVLWPATPRLSPLLLAALGQLANEILVTHTIADTLKGVSAGSADLVLINMSLGAPDIRQLVLNLRLDDDVPGIIAFGSAGTAENNAALLRTGVDAWIAADTPPTVLVEQSRAIIRLRRTCPRIIRSYDLRLDAIARTVRRSDRHVYLSPKEFQLLQLFMTKPEHALTLTEIAREVWGHATCQSPDSYKHVIHSLRQKLDENGKPQMIHTVWGKGYRFGLK